jgi:hypothetical protein
MAAAFDVVMVTKLTSMAAAVAVATMMAVVMSAVAAAFFQWRQGQLQWQLG